MWLLHDWFTHDMVTHVMLDTEFNFLFLLFLLPWQIHELLRRLHTVLLYWLVDWYNCSELWMPCPWYACCIIVRFVWYFWYFGAKLEIFCHCINQFSPISFLACIDVPSILIFFVIKRNTALFHYFVINIVSRLPFSCAGECWAFVFLLIQVLL